MFPRLPVSTCFSTCTATLFSFGFSKVGRCGAATVLFVTKLLLLLAFRCPVHSFSIVCSHDWALAWSQVQIAVSCERFGLRVCSPIAGVQTASVFTNTLWRIGFALTFLSYLFKALPSPSFFFSIFIFLSCQQLCGLVGFTYLHFCFISQHCSARARHSFVDSNSSLGLGLGLGL